MPTRTIIELRARLDEAEETLRAIRSGGVDALVVAGENGPRVYTLEGAEHSYRVLIESMNEGALMLSADATILYANQRFATMLKRPLARVIGRSFPGFLSEADREALGPLLKRRVNSRSAIQVALNAADALRVPAQVSVHRLAGSGPGGAAFSMVVTDLTDALRSASMLRSLSHSLLQTQEVDRRRLAVELHDQATQSLGALLLRLQVLAASLPPRAGGLRREVAEISSMVGSTAEVVEGISRNLRPSVLEILGLVPALRGAIADFAKRTDIRVKVTFVRTAARLSAEAELVFYRVLEESLKNVERHARSGGVTVRFGRRGPALELVIRDDGIGFDTEHSRPKTGIEEPMGLFGLRERLAYVGGALRVASTPGVGTEIRARIPLQPPD